MKPKLLIVCGLGRSGTTLLGALLVRSPRIEVFNEIPHLSLFPGLTTLVDQYRDWAAKVQANPHESWRRVDQQFVDRGVEQIFRGFCRAFAPAPLPTNAPTRGLDLGRDKLLCLKRPEAELDPQSYEIVLPELRPLYLYCVRDPMGIYSSTLSVAWGASTSPAAFLKRLEASIDRAKALAAEGSSRVCVINIDQASRNVADRRRIVERLFHAIGVEQDAQVRAFVEEWPPVNRSVQVYGEKQFLAAGEKEERLAALQAMIEDNQELKAKIEELLARGSE